MTGVATDYQTRKIMRFDGTIRTIKTPVEVKIVSQKDSKLRQLRNLSRRMKRVEKKKGVFQKSLSITRRPEFLVFDADKQIKGNKITANSLESELYRPFKLYNIPLEEKKNLVDCLLISISKERTNIPRELLALAMLNIVDEVLIRKKVKYFNWTFHTKQLDTWRKSCAAKLLKEKGYIEIISTNCWLRTDKKFKRTDFYKGAK